MKLLIMTRFHKFNYVFNGFKGKLLCLNIFHLLISLFNLRKSIEFYVFSVPWLGNERRKTTKKNSVQAYNSGLQQKTYEQQVVGKQRY